MASNDLAFALRDNFPVSPGHTLVVPRRLVATWFEATRQEQVAILDLVDVVKTALDAELMPDGYNVGFNAGLAAGQTVMHLHLHVIPRFTGDVADPRGGVRHVMPGRGNYLAGPVERVNALVTGGTTDPFLHHLQELFPRAHDIAILVAFAQPSGVHLLWSLVQPALARGARLRVITGDYMGITHPEALTRLLGWSASESAAGPPPEVRVLETARLQTTSKSFHPKAWLLVGQDFGVAYVGSSNVSHAALMDGIEWNLRIERERDPAGFARVQQAFDDLWPSTEALTSAWIDKYKALIPERLPLANRDADGEREVVQPPPQPHAIQLEALEGLALARAQGRQRSLVVMATGLGKTWLAGFDLKAAAAALGRTPRVLWLAHRDGLLGQAAGTLVRLFPQASVGFFAGNQSELDTNFVLASVAKLSRPEHLARLESIEFDYAVVDEVHHAAAKSYQAILAKLRANFVLGLTATPDRTDQADIQALLDDHLAFDAGLHRGISAGLLAPFAYYGLKDSADYKNIPWRNGKFDPTALAAAVETETRMERAWESWQEHPGRQTLVFCCTIAHANYVCAWLKARGVRTVAVHSEADTNDRSQALKQLVAGELDAVCAVDLFNEGIDVPSIDRVVMLRPSESPVVFLQQLGRGLRRSGGKESLTVIDFVGNHRVFLQRLRTLLDTAPPDSMRVGLADWLQSAARRAETPLPDGCSVDLAIEAIDLLAELLPRADRNVAVRAFRELVEARGKRPTAGELYRQGLNPRVKGHASWFAFVEQEGQLSADERQVVDHASNFLAELDTTKLTKSFKMVTLQTLIESDALLTGMEVGELCRRAHAVLLRSPELARDLDGVRDLGDPRQPDPALWRAYWRKYPLAAWLGESADKQKRPWFVLRDKGLPTERFDPKFDVPAQLGQTLVSMVAELVDWRLAEYRARPRTSQLEPSDTIGLDGTSAFDCKVMQAGGTPLLKLQGSEAHPAAHRVVQARIPSGELWTFDFQKIACNVAWTGTTKVANQLPALMRRLFGEHAGQPGTDFRVRFEQDASGWRAVPLGQGDAQVLPLVRRVKVPCLPSLRVAAGWSGASQADSVLEAVEEVALPGPIGDGCVAVRVSGSSMVGWRSHIRDGDWLIVRPLPGVGLAAVEGEIAVIARGDTDERTYHCKRVVRDAGGRWSLRSDSAEVPAMAAEEGDTVVGKVVRFVRPEELAPAIGAEFTSVAEAFGLSREPEGKVDRVDGLLFVLADSLDAADALKASVAERRVAERAFVVAGPVDAVWRFVGCS